MPITLLLHPFLPSGVLALQLQGCSSQRRARGRQWRWRGRRRVGSLSRSPRSVPTASFPLASRHSRIASKLLILLLLARGGGTRGRSEEARDKRRTSFLRPPPLSPRRNSTDLHVRRLGLATRLQSLAQASTGRPTAFALSALGLRRALRGRVISAPSRRRASSDNCKTQRKGR